MAPSPALRCSPGREPMAENCHKRGRSLESGLTFKKKDDDLVLFNEMQNQEKDNFLLHPADDIEEALSKLRHFSDFKLGIGIRTRTESSDLLNVEGDKNDYDWLLTPPDTPLFPSLDDECSEPANIAYRGKAKSQPIMISRSMTTRTSSSSYRLSPSPRSSGTSAQVRGRPSSAPRSSSPVVRPATPSRRSSTPPNKQSPTILRSSTPTLRRDSAGSSFQSSNYGGRGASPVKTSHGNSASPKLRGWQMNLPGFTSEVPPNLRTSSLDRHARGSSPASDNGRETLRRIGRKSMSPTSSRSISSSHSREGDHFSSNGKCSMVSSGDDEEVSLHSINAGISRNSHVRKDGALANNKSMSYSRKPSGYLPANSLPKRSFDSTLRLMDQRKASQNMFRPLLSSVPATTFRPIFSRNSSLTTSSNASSEQGVFSAVHDVDGNELEPVDQPVRWERSGDSEPHEEVFLFEKVDEVIGEATRAVLPRRIQQLDENYDEILLKNLDLQDETINSTLESGNFDDNHCDMDSEIMMAICLKCGIEFKILNLNQNINLCGECARENRPCSMAIALPRLPLSKNIVPLTSMAVGIANNDRLLDEILEFREGSNIMGVDCLPNICSMQLLDKKESELSNLHLDRKMDINVTSNCRIISSQLSNHADNSSLKVDIPEGTGISVLLQRSSSSKCPVFQGMGMPAANILCLEPFYLRENANSLMRRSIERDSASASSSVDLGTSQQTETGIQHHKEDEANNKRIDINGNTHSSLTTADLLMNCHESRRSTDCLANDNSLSEILLVTEDHANHLDQLSLNAASLSSSSDILKNFASEQSNSCMTRSSPDRQSLDHNGNDDFPSSSVAEVVCNEDHISAIHADEKPQNDESNGVIVEETAGISGCFEMEEDNTILNHTSQNGNLDADTKSYSVASIELSHGCSESEDCCTEYMPFHNPAYLEQSNEHAIYQDIEKDSSFSTIERNTDIEPSTLVHEQGSHDSGITIEHPRGLITRSLTLEEATESILFCRSIIQDLAYKAASIGIEKELNLLPEAQSSSSTAMADLGKPIHGLRDSWKMYSRHSPSSHKFKRKRMDCQAKSPCKEVENDVNGHEFTASNVEISSKDDAAKPPKLESKCNCTVM